MTNEFASVAGGIAEITIALAGLIASISIPILIYRGQKRRETLEYIRSIREMWVSIDTVVLQDEEAMRIADALLEGEVGEMSSAQRKKRWLSLMILNAVYMDYLGAINGVHGDTALETTTQMLMRYLKDDEFYRFTQSPAAYDPAFRELCRRTKQTLHRSASPPTGDVAVAVAPAASGVAVETAQERSSRS